MAITEFSQRPLRLRIGFARSLPDQAQEELSRRGYECFLLDDAALGDPAALHTTDSIIISEQPDKPSHLVGDLERLAFVLNYDCRLYVRYQPNLKSQTLVLDTISRLKLPPSGFDKSQVHRFSRDWFDPDLPLFAPFVHILPVDENWNPLANLIAANPAGRAPSTSITVKAGTEERDLLIKRAFWDCSSILLVPKTDGLSGVDAFEAFAYRGTNVVGSPAPYRCFVKIGPRVKVAREFEKYRTTALEDVPFHLGPRLRADRCVLGMSQGLITCDYVVGAETLRDCIRDGRGVHVIGNLFNQTLISWRRAATEEKRPLADYLAEHLSERTTIPAHREHAVKAYGATKTIEELKTFIADGSPAGPLLVGVIHGDLHATNVLVRMNDAVIIDLERIAIGKPLLLDAASLEGGLFIDGFVGDRRTVDEVLESIAKQYTADAFLQDDHYCDPANKSAWFVNSVRQIRMQARQMERRSYQYGSTLAAVLLKKACNPEALWEDGEENGATFEKLTRENVRAMAFVLAEKIVLGLHERVPAEAA